jgi:hypothetical protein
MVMWQDWSAILNSGDRTAIISWLAWNDPSGVYLDSDCELEGLPCLDIDAARDYMRRALENG